MREVFQVRSPDGRYRLVLCADRIRVGWVFEPGGESTLRGIVYQELPLFDVRAARWEPDGLAFETRSRRGARLLPELAVVSRHIDERDVRAFAAEVNVRVRARPRWRLYLRWCSEQARRRFGILQLA